VYDIPLLDPDAISKALQPTIPGASTVAAARHVLIAAYEHLHARESFAVETTLSGQGYLRMMIDAGAPSFRALCERVGAMLPGRTVFVASVGNSVYDRVIARAHKFDLENPAPILDEEDERTLAGIDEGGGDAKAGRVVPAEKARDLLPKWTAVSSTRKKR